VNKFSTDDDIIDPNNLRETDIAFGKMNKIKERKKNIDDIIVGPKDQGENKPKELIIPEGFEV